MSPHALTPPDSSLSASPENGSPLSEAPPLVQRVESLQEAQNDNDDNAPSLLTSGCPDHEPYDLVGVGFGPANLALAIALQDAIEARRPLPGLEHVHNRQPRVLFLEKQASFGWHEGMLLPGAKMQISFVKDLATLRDPRSHFTFLNYLQNKQRLVPFTNLDTFLPQRIEYQDYMKWCASHFSNVVAYSSQVQQVLPVKSAANHNGPITSFQVGFDNTLTGQHQTVRARHVVVAVGGAPKIPRSLPQQHSKVLHSSQYITNIHKALPNPEAPYKVAVVGAGQSAAECFNDLHSRYPNSTTKLFIRGDALKPSDDSPFVNEIFDPDRVDGFYARGRDDREKAIVTDKATNYGVVRITLLEELYGKMYTQRIREPDTSKWQHQIVNYTNVVGGESSGKGVRLTMHPTRVGREHETEYLDVDAVIIAAGYERNMHEWMLDSCKGLLSGDAQQTGRFAVRRDYGVEFAEGKVSKDAGIWLQGCNEKRTV